MTVHALCQIFAAGFSCIYFGTAEICEMAATDTPAVVYDAACSEIWVEGSPYAPQEAPLPKWRTK